MSNAVILIVFLSVFVLVIVYLKLLDRVIEQHIAKLGGTLLDTRLVHTAKGRSVHRVWYLDSEGNKHEVNFHIDMLHGNYFEADKIIQQSNETSSIPEEIS